MLFMPGRGVGESHGRLCHTVFLSPRGTLTRHPFNISRAILLPRSMSSQPPSCPSPVASADDLQSSQRALERTRGRYAGSPCWLPTFENVLLNIPYLGCPDAFVLLAQGHLWHVVMQLDPTCPVWWCRFANTRLFFARIYT